MSNDETRYNLSELTDEAGVSVRTVRYYIGEGLLPPPVVAGARSYYTELHLNRLRLIGRLKAAYLPLREIRRRLTALADDEIRALLADDETGPAVAETLPPPYPPPAPPDDAASYISRVLGRHDVPPPPQQPQPPMPGHPGVTMFARSLTDPDQPLTRQPLTRGFAEPIPPAPYPDADTGASAWRRVRLGDDAELLVRDEAYERHRDRIEWLIGWARKVFG